MIDLEQKINVVNWLKEIGIEYYYTNNNCATTIQQDIGVKTEQQVCPSDGHTLDFSQHSTAVVNLCVDPVLESSRTLEYAAVLCSVSPANSDSAASSERSLLSRQLADLVQTLDELKSVVDQFKGCELKSFATNTVFADGARLAPIMLIGEAPGATEDLEGIPFCGESGKLLDKMLSCINISRKTNAYITNTVFWRPPGNRAPTQTEIEICRPFVEKHIALIKPKLIILVGSTAASSLLGNHSGVTKIRQEYYSYSNKYLDSAIATTAIFHPAYLLRQPMQKKTTWYDLLKIQKFIVDNRWEI